MYDSHMHSIHSGDSKMSIDEICETAIEKGLKGITVTEHVSIRRYKKGEDYTRHILNSFADCKEAAEKYKGVLEVRHGMELGEYTTNPDIANDFLNIPDIDLVLGSLHAAEFAHYGNMPVWNMMKCEDFKAEHLGPAGFLRLPLQTYPPGQKPFFHRPFPKKTHSDCCPGIPAYRSKWRWRGTPDPFPPGK